MSSFSLLPLTLCQEEVQIQKVLTLEVLTLEVLTLEVLILKVLTLEVLTLEIQDGSGDENMLRAAPRWLVSM